jgi:hypothetical protein
MQKEGRLEMSRDLQILMPRLSYVLLATYWASRDLEALSVIVVPVLVHSRWRQVYPAGQEKRLSLQMTAFGRGEQASFAPAPGAVDMQVWPVAQERPLVQSTE